MLVQSNNKFWVYFSVSILLHCVVFFVVLYHNQNKQIFLQVPVEVAFYSPVQEFSKKSVVQEDKQEEPKVEKKKEQQKKNKNDIALKSKNKKTKKKQVKGHQKQKKEQPIKTSNFVQNKGIMLENADFRYAYYTKSIVKKISRYWQWSNEYSSYRAVVYFRIEKDGFVNSIEIKESSGDENFDENAKRAIQLSVPFAPLPEGYNQQYLGVYFEFKFK